jgi:hypothetical protein
MNMIFWFENLKARDHLEDLGVDGKTILVWVSGKQCVRVWTGCICFRIGTSDGLLLTW